ncbi:hypothetical protein TNCV_1121791 [Trichonephila clavipes]|nr:hypothetical protein TNCV_1121791 [Trichonephila clavipes]
MDPPYLGLATGSDPNDMSDWYTPMVPYVIMILNDDIHLPSEFVREVCRPSGIVVSDADCCTAGSGFGFRIWVVNA